MKKTIPFALFASLILSSGLRAQYRLHIVLPERIDTNFYRGITSISCNGENCIATEVIFAPSIGDSNVILLSHNGGLTWSSIAAQIPQWNYRDSKRGLYYDASQQFDSLNAIVADGVEGVILTTHDGWKTWRADSIWKGAIHGIYFANVAEGMLQEPFGFYWSTVDSGNHWKQEHFNDAFSNGIACHSYGDSMFRVFDFPSRIFTTHDNWNSWDTTYITYNGPLADTSFHPYAFFFGTGDTLAIEGWRWKDTTDFHASLAMALSTDFGANWNELAVPRNNGIYFATPDQLSLDWKHMVLAGSDSVGRIVQSFDAGAHWECDTVPLSNGIGYWRVLPFAVTGSGRVLAGIVDDSNFLGSTSLAYLEKIPAEVGTTSFPKSEVTVFPNPASGILHVEFSSGTITVLDPLGRRYAVPIAGNTMDVSALSPGVYFIGDGHSRAKFVKE